MKVLIFHIQGLLAFYEVLLGPGAQKRFQWRTKHEQKLRKTATISSHSFNLEFWIPQGDWIFPSQTEAWIACWICNEDAFGPFFATKRKLPRSNPCMFDRPRARPIDRDRIWRHRVPKMSLRCPRMKRMPVLGQKLQLSRNLDIWNHEESEIRLQLIRRIVEYSDWGLHVSCLMLFQKSKLTIHRYLHDVWSQDASTSHPLSHFKLSSQGGRRSALPSSSEFWELGWDGSRTERLLYMNLVDISSWRNMMGFLRSWWLLGPADDWDPPFTCWKLTWGISRHHR